MKLIFALGNPEPKYSGTRHNVGKDFANLLADSIRSNWKYNKYTDCSEAMGSDSKYIVVKPSGHMNEVGIWAKKVLNFHKIELSNFVVVYDELDLLVGEFKLGFAKGSKIHNGVLSIKEDIKSEQFWHLRLGVRNESIPMSVQKEGIDPSRYVLDKFNLSDSNKIVETIKSSVIPTLIDHLSKN